MLINTLCLLLILSLAANGFQAIYVGKLRRDLLNTAKECHSWKIAATHWEAQAHR